MGKIVLSCYDFSNAGIEFQHCSSCHSDWLYDRYFQACCHWPKPNAYGKESNIEIECCCKTPEFSRKQYAQVLRFIRKSKRTMENTNGN